MPRRVLPLVLPVLFLWAGTHSGLSQQATESASDVVATPASSASDVPPGLAPTPPPAPALSAPAASRSADFLPSAAGGAKFYTITASLREQYDDNIYTTRDNKRASAVTEFSPSILINLNDASTTFSGRYTFGVDYYENRPGNAFDYTNEIVLNYAHQFNSRFSISLADQGGYYTEPDILGSVGTPFRNGQYFENSFTSSLTAQWTPLFGTVTSYANSAIVYDNADIGRSQNEDENSFSQNFRFAIYPKYNLTSGFIVDNVDYFENTRGYTNTTLDVGLDWQALPNLTTSASVGGSLTEADNVKERVSPYASVSVDWQLGKRSDLTANYSHTVQATDVTSAVGQQADRFSLGFKYEITSRITTHATGIYTYSTYDSGLIRSGSGFTESDAALDLGASYAFNENFSVESGYYLSDISSQQSQRDYTRNQVYVGVRGTY